VNKIYTIGFTKKTLEDFISRLKKANVERIVDIRLNNSSQLAGFTKQDDLAFFLNEICGAEYIHKPTLAPTKEILDGYKKKKKLDLVLMVGPPIMMKSVAKMTSQRVKTVASLNSIMLDGTGLCGSCRVNVQGEVKFACVDGPEFNAHTIDWKSLMNRNKRYEEEENHACRCKK